MYKMLRKISRSLWFDCKRLIDLTFDIHDVKSIESIKVHAHKNI